MNNLLASQGITLVTCAAMAAGVFVHILKHLIAARRNKATVSLKSYIADNKAETILSALCGFIGFLALPEVAVLLPDIAKTIGLGDKQTVLSSFVAGYMGNSFADFLGGRVASLTGAKQG